MESENSGGEAAVLVSFRNAAAAERRIAGTAAVAHVAAEVCRSGAREIRIALGDELAISAEARADIARACNGTAVRFGSLVAMDGAAIRPFRSDIPLDDEGEAARYLLRQTGKKSDGLVSRLLNRPISRILSAWLLRIPGIRPWHATAGTALIAVVMFLCLALGGRGGLIAGGILFHAASVADGVDGEIARATYRSSARGAVLDSVVDMGTNILFYIGLTISLTHLHQPNAALITAWAVLAGLTGFALLAWVVRQVGEPGDFDILKRFYRDKCPRGAPRLIVDTFVMITSRDFFALGSAFLILVGHPRLVSMGLAGFATLWVLLTLIAMPSLLKGATGAAFAMERGPNVP
ncbi:MAG TPA: CDP-alcohol phosphatidyltransferase family protein [Allosphingosinicella sp.]|jgi:CDP-L-myo-inositol myo-inositolphosphotransferase